MLAMQGGYRIASARRGTDFIRSRIANTRGGREPVESDAGARYCLVAMHLAIYAHPFDLDALAPHGGLARLRDLGFQEVALATSYHDGRWLQPWHPAGRVRFLEDGTVHFRPRGDYGLLRPLASSSVPAEGPSPLERLCAEAPRAGLAVRAWTVFTHNSRLGALHPGLCVENAFGDRYPYALCPAQPAVRDYVANLCADLGRHQGLATIECEALGQMGHKHGSHHDKASFAASGLFDAALSACFCAACRARLAEHGADPEAVRGAVAEQIDGWTRDGDAMQPGRVAQGPDEQLAAGGASWLGPVLAVRARTAQELAAATAVPGVRRAIQVHPHPWFTGSQLGATSAAVFPAGDERVVTCYGEGPDAIGRLLGGWSRGSPRRVCIWPKTPQFTTDADLANLRERLAAHDVRSLAIYHLGLLPWRTIERVAKICRA